MNKRDEIRKILERIKNDLFCEDCPYLNPKEEDQSEQKEPHICNLLKVQVFHLQGHPMVYRDTKCIVKHEKEIDRLLSLCEARPLGIAKPKISKEKLRGALARGYCTERNGKKELDAYLIEDMAVQIETSDIYE